MDLTDLVSGEAGLECSVSEISTRGGSCWYFYRSRYSFGVERWSVRAVVALGFCESGVFMLSIEISTVEFFGFCLASL